MCGLLGRRLCWKQTGGFPLLCQSECTFRENGLVGSQNGPFRDDDRGRLGGKMLVARVLNARQNWEPGAQREVQGRIHHVYRLL